jgi:hypothetical protein
LVPGVLVVEMGLEITFLCVLRLFVIRATQFLRHVCSCLCQEPRHGHKRVEGCDAQSVASCAKHTRETDTSSYDSPQPPEMLLLNAFLRASLEQQRIAAQSRSDDNAKRTSDARFAQRRRSHHAKREVIPCPDTADPLQLYESELVVEADVLSVHELNHQVAAMLRAHSDTALVIPRRRRIDDASTTPCFS